MPSDHTHDFTQPSSDRNGERLSLQGGISRRAILRGMGTAVALPFLESLAPVARGAEAADNPLRMVFFNTPNGAHMPAWKPSELGVDYSLTPILQALSPYRQYVNVLSGLTLDGARAHGDGPGDHARSGAAFLTGCHPRKTDGGDIQASISVDQVAAQNFGHLTRFASLELGLKGSAQAGTCDSGYSCAYSSNLSWRNASSPLAKEIDPAAVFDRLFGGGDVAEVAAARADRSTRRKSVLDYVQDQAKGMNSKLGSADRRKLDEYLYAVRDVEKRLTSGDKLQLGEDGIPNFERPAGVPREWSEHCKLMLDMLAIAIQTDSTRVVSFMLANEGDNSPYPQIGVNEGHHDVSHHGKSEDKQAKVQKINVFHIEHLAHLLSRLAAVEENGRPLLDNTMLVYGSGISDGDRHNHDDLPILLIGGAGGRLRRGSHYQFDKDTPLCNLYVWMLQQAGVRLESFGDSNGVLKL